MHELYGRGIIVLPDEIDENTLSRPSSPLSPLPSTPGRSFDLWTGTESEFDADLHDHNGNLWKMYSSGLDAAADVKLNDPKVIVISTVDPEDHIVKRFHSSDLIDITRYRGHLLDPEEAVDEEGNIDWDVVTLNDLDPNSLITICLLTRPLIEKVIVNDALFNDVYWTFAGLATGHVYGPLCTYHSDDSPSFQWHDTVKDGHSIPSSGSANALRVVLILKAYHRPSGSAPATVGRPRINALIVEWLAKGYGQQEAVVNMQTVHADLAQKTKPRSPKVWSDWLTMIKCLKDLGKTPGTLNREIAGKVITKAHIATLIGCGVPWITDCLNCATTVANHQAAHQDLRLFLEQDAPLYGIRSFADAVEKLRNPKD
ncbi:hypothetical protein B0H14DRAFT_3143245 [Mycena olivaceomarginata]|nr:hypothetical protein B0H14DRAFT_3143245 [Mycena olivaceomarginata]